MPTAIAPAEKTAFIDLVRIQSTYEAERLVDVMVNYEDIPTVLGRQLEVYEANFPYLTELMSVFSASDAALMAAGVYYKKTALTSVTNPAAIINSTFAPTGLPVIISTNSTSLMIVGKSDVDTITLSASTVLSNLYIGPGSTVNMIDSTATDSCVSRIELGCLKNIGATLSAVKAGGCIGPVIVPAGSFYGGVASENPTATCALPVTDAKLAITTHNTIQLGWALPAGGYLFIDLLYRKTGTSSWNKVTEQHGEFSPDGTGYTFRALEKDTFYDFQIVTTCNNGGKAKVCVNTQQTNNA